MTATMTMTLVILIKTFDMKRYLLAIFVTVLTVASCTKGLDEDIIDGNNTNDNNAIDQVTTVLTFTGERPQLDPSTKTAWDAETESIVWSANDKIKIGFTFNGNWWSQNTAASQNNKIKFYQSNEVTIDSENSSIGTFTVPSGFKGSTTSGDYVFYAVFPGPKIDNDQTNTARIPITLNPKQIPAENSFDIQTDILVGKSRTVTSTGLPTEPLTIFWQRVVAHGNFTLKDFQGVEAGETISKVVFTAQEGANLAGIEYLSVTDGTFTGNQTSNVITLDGTNLSFATEEGKKNLNVWLSVIPVTLTSLDVVVETNKATYHKSWTEISKTLKGNARNTMGMNMANATRTAKTERYIWVRRDLSAITEHDVFVIVGDNGSTYAMTNDKGTGSAPTAQRVTVSGNKLVGDPAERLQWHLTKDGDNYTFYPVGSTTTWLYCRNQDNGVRVGTNANKVFTLSGRYLHNTATNRYLGIYKSRDWRCYDNTDNNISRQFTRFYVRVDDAASFTEYTTIFQRGTTFTTTVNNYTGSFVNTCEGLSLTLTNINNSNSTEMYAGRSSSASVATITTNDAIPEAIRTVTLSLTDLDPDYCNSIKLIVSPTSDFSSTSEYRFSGYVPGDISATISDPETYMYYKIVIDLKSNWWSEDGFCRFNKIVYAE